ncbi:MAG: hypothetical protein K2J20_02920 [Bacilli bacterium]|nr:hypothetical protein [Bacilli bacterium]
MQLQHYQQDKAIEFNALYNEINRIIKNYQAAKIDVSDDVQKLAEIKNSCDEKSSKNITQMEAEIIYQEGIKQLKGLKERLKRHEVYFDSYNSAEDISKELNEKNLDKEKIIVFARSTIALLQQIEASDTRDYNSERAIVEKVYGLAYNVIKMELINSGHSTVLDWIRNNNIASNYIIGLIEVDIALLDKAGIANDIIKDSVSELQKDSAGFSYLNEGLILLLALHDEKNIKKIEASLLEIMKEITASNEKIETSKNKTSEIERKIAELKETIRKSRLYKELGVTISLIAILVGLKYGTEKGMPLIGHKEYKTNLEYYSSDATKDAPNYPEYIKKIKDFGQTTLTAYDVWRQENIFYGDYNRNIVTYDLTNIDIAALRDFLEYDFSNMQPETSVETREELSTDELYDRAIVEIVRLTQDPNDTIFVPNEEAQHIFLVIMATIGAILAGVGSIYVLVSVIKKLQTSSTTRLATKEKDNELTKSLEAYKRLCNENEDFSNKFLEMYQRFSDFIKNPTIKDEYQRILQLKNQKENK